MPRYLGLIDAVRRKRTTQRVRQSGWHDPFPEVHGTLPEKMVYAELSRLGIPFYFLNDLNITIPDLDFQQYFQADFYIPGANLIIEVQGSFWHSKEKTIEADAYKFALYETVGYRAVAWWDFDIYMRLHDLIIGEPALLALARPKDGIKLSSEITPMRRTKVDTSKGIRTLNKKRIVPLAGPRISRRKVRKGMSVYASK